LSEVGSQLSQTQQAKYKAINKAAMEYKWHAERKYWKIHMGVVPWCSKCHELSTAYCIGKASGALYKVHHWKFCSLTKGKKTGIQQHVENFDLEMQTIQTNIRHAYKQFHQLKEDPDR